MECKRKTLSNKKIAELENEKMQAIDSIVSKYVDMFKSINLKLVCKYVYLSSGDKTYQDFDPEKERDYTSEYVCQARITVEKEPKKEEPEQIDEIKPEENDVDESSIPSDTSIDEDENEDEVNTSDLSIIEEEEIPNENVLAFTDVMVLRVYKSFFTEYVTVLDDFDDLTKDLDEFYNHFSSNESDNK